MGVKKPDIKIFVSHRIDMDSKTVNNPLYVPVRCGAVYDKRENVDMIGDNTGDNISEKRLSFCELTVQYWAWKNVEADYYGLCHYRRYLSFANEEIPSVSMRLGLMDDMSEYSLDKCGIFDTDKMQKEIEQYDMIIPWDYDLYTDCPDKVNEKRVSAVDWWLKYASNFVDKNSFELMKQTVSKLHPEYVQDMEQYMNGRRFRGYNCFIMKKELFFEMCEFEFSVLFEIEKELCIDHYSSTKNRTLGYLGEWLFSIWIFHQQKQKKWNICEKQLIGFNSVAKERTIYPAFQEKNIPIVLTANDNDRPFLAVCLQSILNTISQENNYDIIILHQSECGNKWLDYVISEQNETIENMCSQYENVSIRFIDPCHDIDKINYKSNLKRGVEGQYYNVMLPWILKKYDKVIYLEKNVLVRYDIAELYKQNVDKFYCAAARDIITIGMINGYNKLLAEDVDDRLKLKNKYNYVNTDVMVMNLREIRRNEEKEKIIERLTKEEIKVPSKEGINVLYEEKIIFLPFEWNHVEKLEPAFSDGMSGCFDYVPAEISTEYNSVKNMKISNLCGVSGLIMPYECRTIVEFWKIARMTPFYEHLLAYRISNDYLPQFAIRDFKPSLSKRIYMKFIDTFFPRGSKRRNLLKEINPHHH